MPDAHDAAALNVHRELKSRIGKLKSERPTFLLKLQVAKNFQHAPCIHFPHNVDFRGRAYPLPPHLNHIGDDVCRGLLQFSEPKPLGKEGLFWLKVTTANLFGKDKVPFEERISFVDDSRELITAVARDPLSSESIDHWTSADYPWQALARCIQLEKVWRCKDVTSFPCSLPIHMDGSCNGLQHYAALGRDEWGAKAVNLVPSDQPQDVYVVVLGRVVQKIEADARNEESSRCKDAQRICDLKLLTRKVVKQTIMTICYGVTFIGAKAQILGQIRDLVGDQVEPKELDEWAHYIATTVLASIDEIFDRAMRIKRWFDEVSTIFNRLNIPVSWLSPIGLPCSQMYTAFETSQVYTPLQRVTMRRASQKVHKAKQRMGFPPNFVHSLDASHMMMVANECQKQGIAFAGVHDSFWTHASDGALLNKIILTKFRDLYAEPILDELREDLEVQLGGVDKLPPLPPQGSFDINTVTDSIYMFA